MQGLRIFSATGGELSSEEMEMARRVANMFKGKSYGHIRHADITTGIIVELYPFKKIALVHGDVGAYFGYDSAVQMRCRCRGLQLIELTPPQVEFNYHSAAFLTDGTELASAPITYSQGDRGDKTNSFVSSIWNGGEAAWMINITENSFVKTYAGSLLFDVPDDACYSQHGVPPYTGTDGLSAQWIADWNAAQEIALEREHARRKKCSDGQLMYLRHGFMSQEVESFVKRQHPISVLVKQSIPMTIESTHYNLQSDIDIPDFKRTQTYTGEVNLSYTDKDGVMQVKTLSGTLLKETITHNLLDSDGNTTNITTTNTYTYTNFPFIDGITGASFPTPQFSNDLIPLTYVFDSDVTHPILRDAPDGEIPLVVEANGVFSFSSWIVDDRYDSYSSAIAFDPSFSSYTPPVNETTDGLVLTHPQFLYDYIKASKPVEIKSDETASTDWLSSRLTHGEEVTVIPLSFINSDGDDRGMYPYSRSDEVPAQVKLVGYAKFKYDYYTGTFAFVSWTEFTNEGKVVLKGDTNFAYNDETNPTAITVVTDGNSVTYNLVAKYFNYNMAWETPNCVCIGNKSPWTDTKAAAKSQKKNISDSPADGYTLTPEELLYKEVRKTIS